MLMMMEIKKDGLKLIAKGCWSSLFYIRILSSKLTALTKFQHTGPRKNFSRPEKVSPHSD